MLVLLLVAGCGGAGSQAPRAQASRPASARVQARRVTVARTIRTRAKRVRARARARRPTYRFTAVALGPALRAQLRKTSWHPGCPVGLGDLRYMRIAYWGFDHHAHLGEMVANSSATPALRRAFATLFAARFPIRQMRLVDRYGGSDYASIQADNTSAFNCRNATGTSHWSQHAFGLAVDINPIENPYVYANGTTTHAASRPYLNRSDVRAGMAVAGGTLVRAFDAVGWGWGGRWPLPTDFQHFSANGR
jgi:hypothetical protein